LKEVKADEKRRLARWKSSYFFKDTGKFKRPYFDVIDVSTNQSVGHLIDLTLEGMKIITKKPLKQGQVFDFRIELPEEVDGVHKITSRVSCVWCERDINPEFYYAGFKIVDMTPPFSEIVDTLISS